MSSDAFGPCHRCGKNVTAKTQDHEYRIRGRIVMIFENVPVGVCEGCGEKVLHGETARRIEDIALKRVPAGKATYVPVVSL